MSDLEIHPVAAAVPPSPGLSQIERVTNVFSAPSKTFEDIKRGNRSWWMPWLILVLVGLVFFAAISMKIGMQQVVDNQNHLNPKQEEKMAQMPPEQRAVAAKWGLYITEGIFIASPVLVLLKAAIVALVLWGTINFVFGGKATFGSVFAVWFYANLVTIVAILLGVIVIFAGAAPETYNIKNFAPTNLGAFLSPIDTNPALYAIATSIDIVTLWMLFVMGMGIAIVAGVKRSSGYIAAFGWYAIIALFGAGVAAIMG
jgi:hypothetical protein